MLHPRRHRDREHGQIIVLAAFALIIVLAFAALVIDLGFLRNDRQRLVNALDAATLSAGVTLPVDGSVAGQAAKMNTLVNNMLAVNYPGLPASTTAIGTRCVGGVNPANPRLSPVDPSIGSCAYVITYKCLIGVDPATNDPLVARDVPAACNPTHALGHAPAPSDFTGPYAGSGLTRNSPCDPSAGDLCNVVTINGSATQQYFFGPVLGALPNVGGITQGSTGAVQSASCNGPCGNSPVIPVDLVIILDRTYSMQGSDSSHQDKITNLKTAAEAVLSVYDPSKQRVALGLTGPSAVDPLTLKPTVGSCGAVGTADDTNFFPTTTLSASIDNKPATTTVKVASAIEFTGAPANYLIQIDNERMKVTTGIGTATWTVQRAQDGTAIASHTSGKTIYGVDGWVPTDTTKGVWVPVGLSGTDTSTPSPDPNGALGTYSTTSGVNAASKIDKGINCISAVTLGTDLATPVEMAQWYLETYGRPGQVQGILLETDGQPQSPNSPYPQNTYQFTCDAANAAATAAKNRSTVNNPKGIKIYTVGYGVGANCPTISQNSKETAAWANKSAASLLSSMATSPANYYPSPAGADLKTIFKQIAQDLARGGSHLVELCPAPVVNSPSATSPATWVAGGTAVISGSNFTGATVAGVRVGGNIPTLVSVSDSSITATFATAGSGSSASVTTPCGTN